MKVSENMEKSGKNLEKPCRSGKSQGKILGIWVLVLTVYICHHHQKCSLIVTHEYVTDGFKMVWLNYLFRTLLELYMFHLVSLCIQHGLIEDLFILDKSMSVLNAAIGFGISVTHSLTLFQSLLVPKNLNETDILPNKKKKKNTKIG